MKSIGRMCFSALVIVLSVSAVASDRPVDLSAITIGGRVKEGFVVLAVTNTTKSPVSVWTPPLDHPSVTLQVRGVRGALKQDEATGEISVAHGTNFGLDGVGAIGWMLKGGAAARDSGKDLKVLQPGESTEWRVAIDRIRTAGAVREFLERVVESYDLPEKGKQPDVYFRIKFSFCGLLDAPTDDKLVVWHSDEIDLPVGALISDEEIRSIKVRSGREIEDAQ
jgi:hypothetical protein